LKKKIETNKTHSRKWRLTFAVLICIFSMISVSLAFSEKDPWIASIEKSGENVLFADHSESPTEGNWIHLSGGKEIQLPQPLSFTYSGPNSLKKAGVTIKLNSESDKKKNTKIVYTYPYSTHPFYTEDQQVTMGFNGSSNFKKQDVDIYLVKSFNVSCVKKVLKDVMDNKAMNVEDALGNCTSYTKVSATLDKNGDLVEPINFGCLKPGSYGIVMTLADKEDNNKKSEKVDESKVLSATAFEVVNYNLETDVADTLKEGDNLDVDMCLKDAPAEKDVTYGAILIKKEAYKADINLSTNGTMAGTDLFINNVGIFSDLGVNSTNFKSKLSKSELSNEVQTLIGEGNGTISIGEKDQTTLSLTTFDLPSGEYFLFTGAYEKGKGLVGIDQKELAICTEGTLPK
jgi:methanogen extracellular protein (TIGR04279 family)